MINFNNLTNLTSKPLEKRFFTFLEGWKSRISLLDALAVGLYWGEGTKCDQDWQISNSDKYVIETMIRWAESVGQEKEHFKAKVTIHEEDGLTDEEVRIYWSSVGIPKDNIRVYRHRTKSSKKVSKNKMECGVCALSSKKNGVRLFEFLKGKKWKLLKNPKISKEQFITVKF